MNTVVVRVWLPDRPGALGQVATRIGAAGGDVVGIEILERGGGSAIDELVVSLPEGVLLSDLLAEIARVEGVAIEDVRVADENCGDTGLAVLEIAAIVVEASQDRCLTEFCERLLGLIDGDWVVARRAFGDHEDPVVRAGDLAEPNLAEPNLAEHGNPPDSAWLGAFIDGIGHLSVANRNEGTPGDVVWVHLTAIGVAVVAGRKARPFHTRERQQVTLLGRIVDARIQLPTPNSRFSSP